jgi:hypothetical protein
MLEELPIVIHNITALSPAPNALKKIDDVSIIEAVPADFEADTTGETSEPHNYGGDTYYPTLAQDYCSTAKLSVNVVRVGAGV